VPDGFQMPRDRENFRSTMDTVDEGYFETMGIPILRGRGFLTSDAADAPRVAVVNEQFAKHFWPGTDAVGQHIRLDSSTGTPIEIVGVARTIAYRAGPKEMARDFVYLPLPQHPVSRMYLMLRSNADPAQTIQSVKDAVRTLTPNLPVFETRPYEEYYQNYAVAGPLFAIDLVIAMGTIGLLLAIAGLYGLVAFNVNRKTREIGIRMALGATQPDVLRLVMGKGLVLVGIGTAIGLAMGFGVERFFNATIFGAAGVDIVAYIVVVPLLFAVTMLATYVPARRAARIEPTRALRYE
jgi:predicted permease